MTPDEKPTAFEFGKLLGVVEALKDDVGEVRKSVVDLQRTNSEEHAANAGRMERLGVEMRAALAVKADAMTVAEQGREIDALKSSQNRRLGRDDFIKGAVGAVLMLAGVLAGIHVHL